MSHLPGDGHRIIHLFIDLEVTQTDGNYKEVMTKYVNSIVLILDGLMASIEQTLHSGYTHISNRAKERLY